MIIVQNDDNEEEGDPDTYIFNVRRGSWRRGPGMDWTRPLS